MTYILIGPGIRDNVTLENLFPLRNVEQTEAITPVKRVEERETPEQPGRPGQQPSGRAQRQRQASQTYEEVQEPHNTRIKVVMAEQIMTSPVRTVRQDLSVAEAWQIMLSSTFRHLPVIESESGHLVGMLSEHDFIDKAGGIGGLPPRHVVDAKIQSVRQLMSSPTLSATEDTELHELSRVMYEQHIGAMPILGSDGHLSGIITHRDILKALIKNEPLELWI
jgi:acetoin utilization protein AcuB